MGRDKLIQPRAGTSAQWASPDDDIQQDEILFNTDTKRFKMGVNATTWENTDYVQPFNKGADVASASALPILKDGNYFDVTGTTTITSINTTGVVGAVIKLHFDGILTLTHHATDLVLPTGANITTAAGDEAEFIEYASGDFRCTNYSRADGTALVGGAGSYSLASSTGTDITFTEDTLWNEATYLTTGDLTLDLTGAVKGVVAIVYCDQYIPGITGTYKRTAGNLKEDALNVITFLYDGTQILMNVGNHLKLETVVLTLTPRDTEIIIDWLPVALATNYVIERALDSGFTTSLTEVYSGSLLTFTDTGLTNFTDYYYRGKATGGGNADSDWSATVTDQPEPNILLNNLVAAYKFADNVLDSTSNNYDGTPTDITYVVTQVGKGADFNGTTSNISVADADDFTFNDGATSDVAMTIALTIRADALGDSGILSKQNEWDIRIQGGLFLFYLYDTSTANYLREYIATSAIGTTANKRVVLTYSGSGTTTGMKMYIDGVLQSPTKSTAGTYAYTKNTANLVYMGQTTTLAGKFNGRLDQVMIYKGVEWGTTEIDLDYAAVSVGTDPIPEI